MAFLYFKNTTATGVWNDVTNWFEDDACTTQAANVPWVAGDSTYLGYDLTRSTDSVTAEDYIYIDADIGDGLTITGTCDIGSAGAGLLFNNTGFIIYSGTWSGGFFQNNGTINGGVFSGNYFANENAVINGGTFTGSNFSNQSNASIYGGKFSGASFSNSGDIYGGLFDTTTGLSMPIGTGGVLFDFTLLSASLFLGGVSWNNGPWYEDYECETLWTGDTPWTTSTTLDKNILRGNLIEIGYNPGAVSIDTSIGQGFTITGTCYITQAYDGVNTSDILNNSSIYGGTFAGDYFYNSNYGTIYGGTFTGGNFTNSYGDIYDGIFSGNNFNNYVDGNIYSGTFSGDYFLNSGYILGGTFSGNSLSSDGYIYGGLFSGDDHTNNNYIYGGIFTGGGFYNYDVIYNGVFSGESFLNQNAANIFGGIYTGNNFVNSGTISGGSWLESGYLDVDIFDYSNGGPAPTITGQIRIRGTGSNPYPLDLTNATGFMTLKIKGQDVLGTGLL